MIIFSRKKIRILAVILSILALFLIWGRSFAAVLEELQSQIQKLEKETTDLEKLSRAYRISLQEKKQEADSLKNRIAVFDLEIKKISNDIALTNQKINLQNLTIESLELEIERALLALDQKKRFLAGLIRTINELDQDSLIEIFFKEERFSDFLDQARYLNLIHQNLLVVLEEIKNLKENYEIKKAESETKKGELEELKERSQAQQYALLNQRTEKKKILDKTKGEETTYQQLLNDTLKEKTRLLQEMALLEKEVERQKNFLFFIKAGEIPVAGIRIFRWPLEGAVLTQGYGMTDFARTGVYGGAGHNGIDMSAGLGASVMAAADGKILVSGFNQGWGNWVAIEHAGKLVTLYAHLLKSTNLANGIIVNAGDVIGYEGSTGFSTGPHLHFSVYHQFFTYKKNDQLYFNYFDGTLNPLNYL